MKEHPNPFLEVIFHTFLLLSDGWSLFAANEATGEPVCIQMCVDLESFLNMFLISPNQLQISLKNTSRYL